MIGKLIPLRRRTGATAEMTDEALVAAGAARDPSALAALYDRHGRDVHRFVVRLRGVDDHVVDDLVQDTFVQAYAAAARFRGGSTVRTWLFAIASNLARLHVRGEVRRRARGQVYLERNDTARAQPDAEAERRELLERMTAALGTLPHDQRVAFLMCDVEEARGIDVAKALGVRQGTLYRRLHDARRALRAAVLGDEP